MTFAFPWALLGLALLPILWWLHRRARPRGDRPYSAYFLVAEGAAEGRAGRRLRAPWLLAARAAALVALVIAAAGPARTKDGGTLVLAAGPFERAADWEAPITVVRAGSPPTLASIGEAIAPVAATPDWGGALLLGRRHAPTARVVRPATPAPAARVVGAGAALDGERVLVSAAVEGDAEPRLRVGDWTFPLERRNGDWWFAGVLPPGPAEVVAGDGPPWPLCLPDASPLPVADGGWPADVEAVLAVLPGVRPVPAAEAAWRPGSAPVPHEGWAPFAPRVTWFEFAAAPDREAAPLVFAGRVPPPGAVVRRWRALADPGRPVLFAGDAVVADHRAGPAGAARRFGFAPEDSDLPGTAGWPVLFFDALEADRAARVPCRTHEAGRALLLAVDAPVTVTAPDGRRWSVAPRDGAALVTGLDAQGLHRLDGAGTAWIAVEPPLERSEAPPSPPVAAPATPPDPVRRPWLALAAALLAGVLVAGRRLGSAAAWIACGAALAALLAPWTLGGEPGRVVLAVDVSGSMPAEATAEAVARLEAALSGVPFARVEGDDQVRRVGAGGGAPAGGAPAMTGGDTRASPLLAAAAELAGPGGATILVGDGRAPDGPAASPVPVFTVAVGDPAPDARLVGARAVRLGDQVFVRAEVAADRAVTATVEMGEARVEVAIPAERPRAVQAVLPAAGRADRVEVVVRAPGDREPRNDRWPVAVEGDAEAPAVVVGGGAAGWAEAAGLVTRTLSPAAMLEEGARFALVRAVLLHDQPADALAPVLRTRLRSWVEAGGLLVLAGREHAFGPGGWAGTDLEALSPLLADPRPPGGAPLGVALLLDRSGSMAPEAGGIGVEGVGRLAGAVAAGLGEEDQLAVLAFGVDAEVLLPPTAAGRVAQVPAPAITRGGTRLAPAIDRALALLARAPVDQRVLVVVSDGQFVDEPEVLAALPGRLAGVRLVAVLVGADPSREPLASLAGEAGVVVEGLGEAVPRLVTAGVLEAGTGLLGGAAPVTPGPAWGARLGGTPPPVAARVRVRARPEARVLAQVEGLPLLAEWAVGRGRVIALATDGWPLAADQWAGLLSPAVAPRPAEAAIHVDGGRLWYEGPVHEPPPPGPAEVLGPGGELQRVPWRAAGPGRAVASLPPGPVALLEVTTASTGGAVLGRVTRPPPAEVLHTGPDAVALAAQAAVTGGASLRGPDADLGPVLAARRPVGRPLSPWLAVLALLAALLDASLWARPQIAPARRPFGRWSQLRT